MYTTIDFKTKKALKEAVAEYLACIEADKQRGLTIPSVATNKRRVTYYQPNGDITGVVPPRDGTIYCEGPHYPKPHMWYAQCTVKDGAIIKVK